MSGAVEKWITTKMPTLPRSEAWRAHKRREVSTVQPVSSVITAADMPSDLPFFRCSGFPAQAGSARVRGCSRLRQGADDCRRCRHGCRQAYERTSRPAPSRDALLRQAAARTAHTAAAEPQTDNHAL